MTIRKIACWRDGSKATHPTGWEICQYQPAVPDRNVYYGQRGGSADPTNTFGYGSSTGLGDVFRDRSTGGGAYDLVITGLFWLPSTTHYFRIDLPSGAGTYDVKQWCSDTNGNAQSSNLQFEDGSTGTVLHTSTKTSTSTQVVDIDGTLTAFASWNWTSAPAQSMTFTQDHVRIRASTSGNQFFDGFSFELSGSPPAANFYNPFISKTFNNNYTRRIR